MINGIEELAFLAGIIMGSVLLLAVSWVWIKKQVLGGGGIIMSLVGLALVGLVVWSSIRIEASPEGLSAEFERQLRQVEQMVNEMDEQVARVDSNLQRVDEQVTRVDSGLQDVVAANISFSESIESLAASVETNNRQFVALTADLERNQAINSTQLQNLNENIVVPQIETETLLRQRQNLEAIQRNR